MKVSDYVIDFIAAQGVSHIFEFIGGAITHLIDSAADREDIHCVSVHHEQSGAFAAEAYARVNGNLGVAMATSGPGALNMVTGIGSCYFDSVSCLFITGQVNTYEYKFDRPVRQIGFQETDIVQVVSSLTKYAHLVTDPQTIRYHLEKAVFLARSGRPGPVLLDIPMNIQRAEVEPDNLAGFWGSVEHAEMDRRNTIAPQIIDKVLSMLAEARRPMILAGGGVRLARAESLLAELVRRTRIPVVTSLMGLDAVDHGEPLFMGMIGAYGNRYGNLALANCDFLLILGSRLDTRQTGTRVDSFARAARKVHVDIDPHELNAKVMVDLAVQGDAGQFLGALNYRLRDQKLADLGSWHQILDNYRRKYPTRFHETAAGGLDPNHLMEILARYCSEKDVVCLDVGQNQMWAAQSLRLKKGQRMLISGGMGAMGFALPAALGAAKASPDSRIIVISGDGGIQVNIQDLETIARHELPVKIIVLNNGCLGMVRQFQDMYFRSRRQSTVVGYGCPDLMKIAEGYGLPAFNLRNLEESEIILDQVFHHAGPVFLNIQLAMETCVNPKLVVNRPIEDMSPHLDRETLGREMLIHLVDEGDVPK